MAETSIILVDARKGLLEQSYRHFYISHLLRLKRVIFAVNKMDLIDYDEDRFWQIAVDIQGMVKGLSGDLPYNVVPVSSLKGDNIVHTSEHMPWYTGQTLNELLHTSASKESNSKPFRFDVQHVIHSQENGFVDYRGYAGRVISGSVAVGDTLRILPSNKESVITEIRRFDTCQETAVSGDSISISLADELDISRGAVFTHLDDAPDTQKTIQAVLVWMDEKLANTGSKWLLKAGSREFPVKVQAIHHKVDPTRENETQTATEVALNDIATVELRLAQPAFLDSYESNKNNGRFILIDPQSNNTVAVGFVQ
jgi:sulfate adenylyltransferase subunit 1